MLWEHNIQMFCAKSDYGDRKWGGGGENESGMQIPKDLGVWG